MKSLDTSTVGCASKPEDKDD